ncbi:MAG: DNA methyltransferase [Candidatus Levybacteria bacterium]|nr:DNA methyltransferase [Candidatus Levybacteria bacterium]
MHTQNKSVIDKEELEKIQKESEGQERPDQKSVISVSSKLRKRLHNLPDPTNPPLGYDDHKAFDRVFPYINIPALHPKNHGDTVIFNDPQSPANKLYLGDNLEVLRTLPSNSIDLIYIDPPFFSGRNYNVIWGDSNEVRTFEDIWEGGITSYLIWLNARLWEMRRVLKNTGSIYVHCDWHASHYIKTEMDKIFGYENFVNEVIWWYHMGAKSKKDFSKKHDIIFLYSKSKKYTFEIERVKVPFKESSAEENFHYKDEEGRRFRKKWSSKMGKYYKYYLDEGKYPEDVWDIPTIPAVHKERIGYPTQKPEVLLERIIKASSNEGEVVADFFVGGGTTLAVAQKLKRKFIGCDSSRVAVSVTLDRLVKVGEEMSGVKSNISTDNKAFQLGLQTEGTFEKVPNIEVYYLGVYPVEKFKNLNQEEFINFVLTAYGASRNTGAGVTHGYRPPAQQEPIYIGHPNPNESIDVKDIKTFFDEIKAKVQVNQMIRAKIVAWRFSRQVLAYVKALQNYSQKYNLPIELEAIPLDSKAFRQRILQRMPDVEDAELFLRFSKPPVIGDIKIKKIGLLEYEFEAVDAISTNEDGWLVNAQWDFDYQEGHFSADKDYVLSREKKKDPVKLRNGAGKKRGEIFEAVLKAKHKFDKEREYVVACKVQDNLAGETILSKKMEVTK